MNTLMRIFKNWLPLAFAITVLAGLTYVAVQQNYRQSANDPQIQMAEDAAAAVTGGTALQSLPLSGTVNIGASLSPYLVFYSPSGTPVGGNGLLNGKFPLLPPGVFSYTQAAGEDRFTWQPAPGIRQAVVVDRIGADAGFVMAGRSLREVEWREGQLELMTDAAWITALVGSFLVMTLFSYAADRRSRA